MIDTTPRALDLANPFAPHHLWEPEDGGVRGKIFVFGYAGFFCNADYVFLKGSDASKRSMYRIIEKTNSQNENHQWHAELEYISEPPPKYALFPPLGSSAFME